MKKGDLVRAKMDVSIVVPKGSTGIIVEPAPCPDASSTSADYVRYVRWFSLGRPTWALIHRLEVINEEG